MQNMRPLRAGERESQVRRSAAGERCAHDAESAEGVTGETDKELVRRVQKGDRRAFDLLFTRYRHKLHALVGRYVRDLHEVDDVVQEAFVKAFQALGSYREDRPFETWFWRILTNATLDRLKSRQRRARWQQPMPDGDEDVRWMPASDARTPEAVLVARETVRAVRQAIDDLPARQRLVLLLSHLDGRTSREVSQMTGISESTVRVHLHRAVHRLRRALERAGF